MDVQASISVDGQQTSVLYPTCCVSAIEVHREHLLMYKLLCCLFLFLFFFLGEDRILAHRATYFFTGQLKLQFLSEKAAVLQTPPKMTFVIQKTKSRTQLRQELVCGS